MGSSTILTAAQDYGRAGWRVLPCRAADSAETAAKAPHISNWKHRATGDPRTIYAWWQQWPDALIGLLIPHDLIVVDIDPRNGGSVAALADLIAEPIPHTLTCMSGRGDGGRHYYFQRTADPIRTGCNIATGIDVLADRYVIAPPSLHPATGMEYRWEHRTQPVPIPRGLIALLRPPGSAPQRAMSALVTRASAGGDYSPAERLEMLSKARHGKRNTALFRTALTAFQEQWERAPERLEAAALAAGLEVAEIRNTIASARRLAAPASRGKGQGAV